MNDFEKKVRIRDLKQMLSETDYVVIKANERMLLGEPISQSVLDVIAQRRAWRVELNSLEQN